MTGAPWLPATVAHVHVNGTLDLVHSDGETECNKSPRIVEILDLNEILGEAYFTIEYREYSCHLIVYIVSFDA